MTTQSYSAQVQYGGGPPVALAPPGVRYFDTTTAAPNYIEYVSTGAAWVALGSGSSSSVILAPSTVGALPAAAAGNKGWRGFVTDSNATTTAGIGAVVAAGGANANPVYSDGAAWRIG